jgi:hypothetical protein
MGPEQRRGRDAEASRARKRRERAIKNESARGLNIEDSHIINNGNQETHNEERRRAKDDIGRGERSS